MWGYLKASWKALMKQPQMELTLHTEGKTIHSSATMVVLANATRYGTGARINPVGRLDDRLFEVIILKKISLTELYKMMVSHAPYDTSKIEIFQTGELSIHSEKRVHFQVDGEYLGKVNDISAHLVPGAIRVIVPRDS
jgi:diacylglycerol kinase family enzyme